MKNKNKRRIILGIFSTVLLTVFCACMFIGLNNHKEKNTDNGLVEYLDVDLTSKVEESLMNFSLDSTTKTATFTGMSYYSDKMTLEIPSKVYQGTDEYKVTRFAVDVDSCTRYYNSITALIIPDTVVQIDEAALFGFCSLEYLKTPLIGQVIDDTSSTDELKDMSLGSMFSYPSATTSDPMEYPVTSVADPSAYNFTTNEFNWILDYGYTKFSISAPTSPTLYSNQAELWYYVDWYNDSSYSGKPMRYYIPRSLKKVEVTKDTSLCPRAFAECGTIEEVILPDTMKDLSQPYIFYGMNKRNLSETTTGSGIWVDDPTTNISGLTSISLPKTCGALGVGFLGRNDYLEEVVLPEGLLTISEGCFYKCSKLTKVSMPSTVRTIENGAFNNCTSLADIALYADTKGNYISGKTSGFNIPIATERIGKSAFALTKFTSISFPENTHMVEIGGSAFGGCDAITSVSLPFIGKNAGGTAGAKENCLGWIFGGTGSGVDSWFDFVENNSSAYGTTNVECQIGSGPGDVVSFWLPSKLSKIEITNETAVAPGALQGLSTVTSISLNKGITSFALACMRPSQTKGSVLQSLTVPNLNCANGAKHLGAYFGSTQYTNSYSANGYYIPKSLKTLRITNANVMYSGSLNNVTSIEDCTIDFTGSSQVMQSNIFHNNINLTNLTIPFIGQNQGYFGNYYYGNYRWIWWYEMAIKNNVCWIFSDSRASANDYWYSRYWDTVDNGTNGGAPYKKFMPKSLKNLTITNETRVYSYGLHGLRYLENLSISDTCGYIEEYSLGYLDSLESIRLPFIGCYNPTDGYSNKYTVFSAIFGPSMKNSTAVGQIYRTQYIPNSLKTIEISDQITWIPAAAFANLSNVETITCNGVLDHLSSYAFYNCTNLTNLNIPNRSYDTIGNYAFYGCKRVNGNRFENLATYDEYGNLITTSIGSYAFAYTNLVSTETDPIPFGEFVYIGPYAFANCLQIQYADLSGNIIGEDGFGEGIFAGCASLSKAIVERKISPYLFKDCMILDNIDLTNTDIDYIPDGMFMNCKSLMFEHLTQKQGTTSIGSYAFYGCESLGKFIFDESTKSIGSYAFTNCKHLEPMTIPKNMKSIASDAFWNEGSIDEFCFWVYYPQVNWPATWVNNWNCDYLVYVIGDADPDIFTYEYRAVLKGYVITGMTVGNSLVGAVRFPEYRNGVPIRGIDDSSNPVDSLKISAQHITRVILPSTYITLNQGVFGSKLDKNKHTVEIYMEATDAEAKKSFGADPNDWVFLGQGIVYTKEYWSYGSTATSMNTTPFLNVSKLKFVIDPDSILYLTYDGTAKTIQLASVDKVGYVYGDYDTSLPVDIFNLTYQDNVRYGTAKAIATVNSANLATYNADRTSTRVGFLNGSLPVDVFFESDLFIGENTLTFQINKKKIYVYPSETNIETTFDDKFYYLTNFNNSNVSGLEGTNFTLSGRLRTNSFNAGTYTALDEKNGDFVWETLYIYLQGSNVTDNFDVYIGDLTLTINPKEIYVGFANGEWSTNGVYQAGALLFFQYTAAQCTPVIQAYACSDDARVSKADPYIYYSQTTAAPIYPTYDRKNNTATGGVSIMKIGLKGTTNYILRYYDGTHLTTNVNGSQSEYDASGNLVQSYNQEYYVVNAVLKIKYYNINYVIAPEADNWELTNFTPYYSSADNYLVVEGLGYNSSIQARLYNIGRGSELPNAKGDYAYNTNSALSTISFEQQFWVNQFYDFLILRTDGADTFLDNQYYDLELECDVRINYNEFDVNYYIDGIKMPYTITQLPDWNNEDAVYIIAEADGDTHTLTAQADNIDLAKIRDYNIVYLGNKGTLEGVNPIEYQRVGTYYIGVRITAKNYETFYMNVRLDVIKGNVKFGSLSKEYDALRVDLDAACLKKDANQNITYRYYEVWNPNTSLWEAYGADPHDIAPYEVGKYRVHVKVEYPANFASNDEYFNNFDNWINFEITKRTITIDITGTKPYDDQLMTWEFAPGLTDYNMISSYLLNGDEFIGTLSTNSADEGQYNSSGVHWSVQWGVFNTTTGNNSSNYTINIVGTYEITLLEMIYSYNNYDGTYDGMYHSILVNVVQDLTKPACNYTIYYSGEGKPANSLTNPTYIDAKADPFAADDVAWLVGVDIVAPHYQPVHIDCEVMIRRAELSIANNSYKIGTTWYAWDNNYHYPEIIDLNPFYLEVWYYVGDNAPSIPSSYPVTAGQWTQSYILLKDPGIYSAHAIIVAPNYKYAYENFNFEIGSYAPIDPSEVTITNGGGVYNGFYNAYGAWEETEYSITVQTNFASNYQPVYVYYSADPAAATDLDHASWDLNNPKFTQVGTYPVYVKVIALGKEPTIFTTGSVTITPANFPTNTFTVTGYSGFYDSQYHSVTVSGIDNILQNVKGAYVAYSIDQNAYVNQLDLAFDPDASKFRYKDVGLYTVYVAVIAPNYNSIYGFAQVDIQVATIYATVELDENKMQYQASPIDPDDIFVTVTDNNYNPILDSNGNKINCYHDGAKLVYFYPAALQFDGSLKEDKTQLISAPTELGYYYVEIIYRATKNCYQTTAKGYIQIVPRVLKLIYETENEYNGLQQYPLVSVNSGTSDIINVIITETSGKDPVNIGTYNFDVDINMISGKKSNYVLDVNNFNYEITPIKIYIGELLEDPSITGSGRYSATGLGVVHLDYDGERIEIVESDLANSDFAYLLSGNIMPGDRVDVSFKSTIRSVETRVWLLESDGIVHKNSFYLGASHHVYDSNGIDVSQNYEFIIGLEVSKWYAPYKIPNIPDAVYVFDGEEHYPNIPNIFSSNIQTPIYISGNPTIKIASGTIANITPTTVWSNVLSERIAGEYTYTIMATGPGRQPSYAECKLIIEKAPIDIVIDPLNVVYDAQVHDITFQITNFIVTYATMNILDFGTPEILYYNVNDVSLQDLDNFYQNYSLIDPIYALGKTELKNAGKYYAVVYYPESLNFKASYAIKEVEIERKAIHIDVYPSIYQEKDYDGDKLTINLGVNANINENDLIPGHELAVTFKQHILIRTVSANAGRYESQSFGFEFVYPIYDEDSNEVQMNYYPYVEPECIGVIKKIDLNADSFKVEDVVKEYDGLPAMPKITTLADGKRYYMIFSSDEYYNCTFNFNDPSYLGTYDPLHPSNASLFANVGYYVVVCCMVNSTNYNDLTNIDTFNVGRVQITPKEVEVTWENLVQDFNNTDLHPDAYFIDVFGNKVILDTIFTDGVNIVTTKRAGKWPVIATFANGVNDPNYSLKNASELFEIIPVKIIIPVEVVSDYLQAKWSMPIYITDEFIQNALDPDLLATIKFGDTYGHEFGNIYTISSNPGAYTDPTQFEYDIKVYDLADGYDVSDGFIFEVDGYVRIKSNELQYQWTDKSIVYDGKVHDIWELITMINPTTTSNLGLTFSTFDYTYDPILQDGIVIMCTDDNGEIIYSSNIPTFKNIGYYTVYFRITASGYTDSPQYQGNQEDIEIANGLPSGFHMVNFEITRADSYLAIQNQTIDKVYDGIAVSSTTLSTSGGYNGYASNLKFEFYEGTTTLGNVMTTNPVNVGTYTVHVTSNYDTDPAYDNEIKNYTALDVVKTFNITPAQLKLYLKYDKDLNFDVEVDNTILGTVYSITETGVAYNQSYVSNMASGDRLDFVFSTGADVIYRGHHIATLSAYYNSTLVNSNGYLVLSIPDEDSHTFSFQYKLYNTSSVDTTYNYDIDIELDLYVHYPYIDATIDDVYTKYDGNAHSGTPTLTACTSKLNPPILTDLSDLTIYYSKTGIEGDYSTTNISYTLPGKYKVYYRMVDTQKGVHEDKYDSYYITIEKLERTYGGGIIDPDKSYDGQPAGIYDTYTGLYMPDNGTGQSNNYSLILETVNGSAMTDNYDKADVTITYRNTAYSGALYEAVLQGDYTYKIIIPESDYYKETEITGTFKISKAIIYIEGTYFQQYNGQLITYSDFSSTNLYYNVLLGTSPLPSNLQLIATLQTAFASAATYNGADPNFGLSFVVSGTNEAYYILDNGDDVTSNYSININNANIIITKAQMVPESLDNTYEYDGQTHYASMTMKTPSVGVTYLYSTDPNCVSNMDDPSYWSSLPVGYSAVGSYTVYAKAKATNYETEVFTLTLNIVKAASMVYIPDLTREYNAEVLEPSSITTNSDVIRENWVIKYSIWDEKAGVWLLMDGTTQLSDGTLVPELRPINIGKYRIEVNIPESQSYLPVTGSAEFRIYGKAIRIYWPTRSFVYNACSQVPMPTFDGVYQKDFDNGTFTYHIEVFDSLTSNPAVPIEVGLYRALAILDSQNYIFAPDDESVVYSIIKRTITVKSNGALQDDGTEREIVSKYEYDANPTAYDHYFTVNNLAINSAGVSDYVKPGTVFTNVAIGGQYVGTYQYFSQTQSPSVFAQNFRLNGYSDTSGFTILGQGGLDVTKNYNIVYELSLVIDYSSLDVEIVYDPEHGTGNNTGGIYDYDGAYYSYTVDVDLSNPSTPYTVYFSYDNVTWIEDNLANANLRPKYRDVPKDLDGNPILLPGSNQSKPYEFYIKVVSGTYQTILPGYITINQQDSNFNVSINGSLGKIYDNTQITLPTLSYSDDNLYPNRIEYQYEQKQPDGTYAMISNVPVLAGEYRMTLIPDNIGVAPDFEYANYTPIDNTTTQLVYTFVIQKRPVAFDITKFNHSDYYKVYDGTNLAITISNSHFVYSGDSTKVAIVPGDTALGQLQTKSADVGIYEGFGVPTAGLIQFGSIGNGGFEISPNKLDCYDIDWSTLKLEIAKATIVVSIKNISVVFDGLPHVQTVASKDIIFTAPSSSLDYANNMPYGYRIYYGLSTANIAGFVNQVNAGNEDSINPASYGLSLNEMSVAQTNVTAQPVPIVVVITCKNYNCWVSDNSLPITIEILAKTPTPPNTSGGGIPGGPGGGYGTDPDGGPGLPGSGGGSYPQKPGYNPPGSIFPNLEYDGDITYDGLPYMDPSRTGLTRNKPYYNDPTYGSDPAYEAVQTVTYYYYGTDFTQSDYNITRTIQMADGSTRMVGPVNENGSNVPTSVGEYIFLLEIGVFDNVGVQYFYQYFEIQPKDVTLVWDNATQMTDNNGNLLYDTNGDPIMVVRTNYQPGTAQLPEAYYEDINSNKIGTTSYGGSLVVGNSQINAGTYTVNLLADNSPGAKNYNRLNTSITFIIDKLSVSDIVWPTNMKVQYGDQIELIDANNLKYVLDSQGAISDIIDLGTGASLPGFDPADYPFKFDIAAMEIKPDLDSTNPNAGDTITISISLDDPQNYQWLSKQNVNNDTDPANDNTESDDLSITFTVIPRDLETDTEWDYIIEMPNGSAQPIYAYTGNAITPLIRVKLINKADSTKTMYLVHPLKEVQDADGNDMTDGIDPTVLKYDFTMSYQDNINPSDDPNTVANPVLAKIILSTPNTNFVFGYEDELDASGNPTGNKTTTPIEITKEFIIKDPYPTTIQLVAGSVMQFIQVSYSDPNDLVNPGDKSITMKGFDASRDGLSYDSDGWDDNLVNRDEIVKNDTTGLEKDSIYLGRLYQKTFLSQYLDQISNDKNRMIVYNQNGEIVDRKYWDTSLYTGVDETYNNCYSDNVFLGTGWRIELYDEVIVDSDGAGGYTYRGTIDSTNMIFTPTSATKIDDTQTILYGDSDGNGYINNADANACKIYVANNDSPVTIGIKYYASIIYYITDYSSATGVIVLNNACANAIKKCVSASSGDPDDFNSAYILP